MVRQRWWTAVACTVLVAACSSAEESTSTTTATTTATTGATTHATTNAGTTTPATPSPEGDAARIPLVVDTDLASDDVLALLYLVSHPQVDLLAVTVTGAGEVTCPRGADIAAGLLTVLGAGDVPVACGRSTPLDGDRTFPSEWRAAADAAYGLALRTVHAPDGAPDAVELLTTTINGAAAPVTVLTLGPVTNVAEALRADPGLASGIARLVVMGGAVDVAGNVQPAGAAEPLPAEWNLYIDPTATAEVIAAGVPITLVGLDATNSVPVDAALVERMAANERSTASSYAVQLLRSWVPPFLWDPLAAMAATDPALVPTQRTPIEVIVEGEDAGRTLEAPAGSPVDVATAPDAGTVVDHFLRTLAGVAVDEPLATPTTVPLAGRASVAFDGERCTYDGPELLTAGALEVTVAPGDVPFAVVVAHLVAGATFDEALAYAAEHPDEQPPMIDAVAVVGDDAMPSPARVQLIPGDNPVVCATQGGDLVLGAIVAVGAG
jgi:inosine-uridine nucleoside N-ribohydrolase